VQPQKEVERVGEWPRNTRRERVGGRVGRREVREGEEADRWDPRASKGEHENERSALIGQTHRAARGSGRVGKETSADRSVPPGSGRERERARGHS
jgi:hypothetical protein